MSTFATNERHWHESHDTVKNTSIPFPNSYWLHEIRCTVNLTYETGSIAFASTFAANKRHWYESHDTVKNTSIPFPNSYWLHEIECTASKHETGSVAFVSTFAVNERHWYESHDTVKKTSIPFPKLLIAWDWAYSKLDLWDREYRLCINLCRKWEILIWVTWHS